MVAGNQPETVNVLGMKSARSLRAIAGMSQKPTSQRGTMTRSASPRVDMVKSADKRNKTVSTPHNINEKKIAKPAALVQPP